MRKYRQTYIRGNIELRSEILGLLRSFFKKLNFIEVETPIRIPAPLPEMNIYAQESGRYFLHSSPELYMKRLVAAGYNKIFQICKCFRKHERGSYHLPEMTILEWYEVNLDYKDMMVRTESLVKYVANQLKCKNKIFYKEHLIDFSGCWDRITVAEAFERYASVNIETAINSDSFEEVMCLEIEPKLGIKKPVFLYDYPASLGALARLSMKNSSLAERFELYCAGIELCNAFSELTDSVEQRNRFHLVQKCRKKDNMKIYPVSDLFLNALDDMPPTSGNAMGIDRLIMFFANAHEIDQVVAFTPEEL